MKKMTKTEREAHAIARLKKSIAREQREIRALKAELAAMDRRPVREILIEAIREGWK